MIIGFILPGLLALSVGPAVAVNGDGTCPTTDEVSSRVAQLVPALDAGAPQDVARLEEVGGVLRVSLWRPDGALVGTRELARTSSCAELAAAAAVVVAAWESDVHPEFRPSLASIEGANAGAAAPAATVSSPSPPEPTRMAFEVGAALSGSVAPSGGRAGTAAGGLIVASAGPAHGSVALRLMLAGSAQRELPLGAGHVLWQRLVAGLGPDLRLATRASPLAVDLHAEALVALLSARGEGFTPNLSDGSFDAGLSAGVRFAFGGGTVAPWLDLSLGSWLRSQHAVSAPDQASVTLPRVEAAASLGLSLFTGR